MPDIVDRLGSALLDASLAATAISVLVVLAMIQSRQPARRRAWARAGLLATLMIPPLTALNPVPRLDLGGPLLAIVPSGLDEPGPRPASRPAGGPAGPDRGRLPTIGRVAVLAHAAGAAIGLGWLGLGLWGSARLVRRARPASAEALALMADLSPGDPARGRPRLLVSDRAAGPVLVGVFRPTILIPADFDRPDAGDRLRLGLLHELAHAGSSDHLFGPAAAMAQAIWFFLPPVWWLRDRLRLDSEFLADRRAVADFGTSGRYASSLVALAGSRRPVPPGPLPIEAAPAAAAATTPTPTAGASPLFQRVLMLLKCPFPIEDRPPAWWRWATSAAVLAATLAASCLTLRGLAGRPDRGTDAEPARSFRLARLDIAPAGGDESPFDLRLRLPDRFTLRLEIEAGKEDLPSLEVLGYRLGPAADADADADGSRGPTPTWHRVEIRRAAGREEIRVDGLAVDPRLRPRRRAFWLTIRPARGRTARIRDLELAW